MIQFANRDRWGRHAHAPPIAPFTGSARRVEALITDCRAARDAWITYHRVTPTSFRKLTRWTEDEVGEMRYLHRQGHTTNVIAYRLGRTFYSVDTKLRRLLRG